MKKRILFLLHIPPPVHGAALMGQSVKKSVLINSSFETSYINLSTSTSIKQVGRFGIRKIFSLLKILMEVYRTVRSIKPDLCYMTLTVTNNAFLKDYLLVRLLQLMQVPIIFHLHNKGISTERSSIRKRMFSTCFKDARVILLSPLLAYDLAAFVKPAQISYCANGITATNFDIDKRSTDAKCRFLFLSNMMKEKGVMELLRACALLKNKGIDFSCRFAGAWFDITEVAFQEAVQQLRLEGFVHYEGAAYGIKKEELLKESDALVFPTYYHHECFPLVILEAMHYGLPVVTTMEGAIPEIIDQQVNGLLVQEPTPTALAQQMERLALDPILRKQMGKNGQLKARQLYTTAAFEQRLLQILQQPIINQRNTVTQ